VTTADHIPSRGCYQRGCRDNQCTRINKQYETQLELDHLHGYQRKIDATQTRNHIERLHANGWINRQIAEAANVSRTAISDIARGQAEARTTTATAVLALRIGPPPVQVFGVDATGTIRRIQALMYLGHTCKVISTHTGIGVDKLQRIAAGWFPRISEKDATTVARAYRRLIAIPGHSDKTRAHARKKGWHGPLAWDAIDDPKCKPDAATGRERPGRERQPVDPRSVVRLTGQGLSAAQIASRLGVDKRTVTRARSRARDLEAAA
jgi:transcriptional regulator with XRE-family HTH domain